MGDYRDLLEQERRRFRMPGGSMQDLERRRDRRRRNRRIASGIVALIVAAAGLGAGLYALRPTGTVKPVVSPTPTVTPSVSHGLLAPSGMVQFVDTQKGWAVGPDAEILATVDGGKTWTAQYSGPLKVLGVQFIDDVHGWAVVEKGLLRTVDGGASWNPSTDQTFSSVQFVNSRVGWGISDAAHGPPGRLWMSPDGGDIWLRSGLGFVEDSVCAANEKVVWASGRGKGGLILARSDDGGRTWVDGSIPVPPGEFWTTSIRCAGSDAWVLLTDGGAAGHLPYALFHTTSGGPDVAPVLQEAGTRPLGDVKGVRDAQDPYSGPFVAFSGDDALFLGACPACGNSVAIYEVMSGARTVLVKEGATPLGMSFADREYGWILLENTGPGGGQQTVMATSDGGKTWSTLG
jgi:photosystem II stability/assembly factor-like uncharacterized protein